MRVGFLATLFFSSALVWAAPSTVQERDLLDNVEQAADQLLSINIESILSVATPIVESVIQDATSVIGSLATDTGLTQKVTSLLSEAESALGPTGTAIANGLEKAENIIVTPNGASSRQDLIAMRPLSMGVGVVVGSVLLGTLAAL